jgi:hypothetical protein
MKTINVQELLEDVRAQRTTVYLKRIHVPFEGNLWVAILVETGEHFGTYQTKKSALLDCKYYNFKVTKAPE